MDLSEGKRMFGSIKSKLGLGSKNEQEFDEYYDDYGEFDDMDGYGEYGYEEPYESEESRYDSYAPVTTREAGSRRSGTMPRLVSIEDVRAATQVPSMEERGYSSYSSSSRRASGNSFRTMVDSSLPPQMTPEGTRAASAAASATHTARSEGLNSLFEPTTDEPQASTRNGSGTPVSAIPAQSRFANGRSVRVIAPHAYGDAEQVSLALRAGDAVLLNLTMTPEALMKRILDFSFGVACALDGNVEAVGHKMFALTRGSDLSAQERADLKSQGLDI